MEKLAHILELLSMNRLLDEAMKQKGSGYEVVGLGVEDFELLEAGGSFAQRILMHEYLREKQRIKRSSRKLKGKRTLRREG